MEKSFSKNNGNKALLLDSATISKFYEPWALIRDPDQAEVVKAALQGVGSLKFNFNTNAPMLDIWSQNTLELAGVVAPKHNKKVSSPISKPSYSSAGAGIDDTFSEVSSFVSESTAMTEAFDIENTTDGVQGETFKS